MKKKFRIRKSRDFAAVSRFGLVFSTGSVVVRCGPGGDCDVYRVGFTASKKVGNAVVRNRCKRRMRAVADRIFEKIGLSGIDYVLTAKKNTCLAAWKNLEEDAVRAVCSLNDKILKRGFGCKRL